MPFSRHLQEFVLAQRGSANGALDIFRSAPYVDVLGLSVLEEPFSRDQYDEVILQVPGRGRIGLCLRAHRDNDRSSFDPCRTGLDHVAFAVSTLRELHEWVDRLDCAGVAHSGVVPNRGFGHLISLRDPDDIQVGLHTLE